MELISAETMPTRYFSWVITPLTPSYLTTILYLWCTIFCIYDSQYLQWRLDRLDFLTFPRLCFFRPSPPWSDGLVRSFSLSLKTVYCAKVYLLKWIAFLLMIVLACLRLANRSSDELGHPPVADLSGIPNLFGACIYSFMCHHSLPSLVTPISPKRHIYRLFTSDYIIVAGFYLLLSFTGIFAFPVLNDLYTLNFVPDRCSSNDTAGLLLDSSLGGDTEWILS